MVSGRKPCFHGFEPLYEFYPEAGLDQTPTEMLFDLILGLGLLEEAYSKEKKKNLQETAGVCVLVQASTYTCIIV